MRIVLTRNGQIEVVARYTDMSPATGAMVLLHGIQGTAAAWEGVVEHLEPGRAVLMPNLRGRGHSATPADPAAYTLESFAADLNSVIMSVNGPVTLVGWSMGVLVALTYLRDFGAEALDALVLASGTACPGKEAVWFRGTTVKAIEIEAAARAERLKLTACASGTAVAGSWMSARRADLRPVLSDIAVPVHVLHGDMDDQCPLEHGRVMAEAIPGAAFDVWKGVGHNLMAEHPRRFAKVLSRFHAEA